MEDWKFVTLLVLATAITFAGIFTLNALLIASSLIAVLGIALLYRFWYFIEAAVFKHTRIVELFDGYELSGAREVAIRKVNGAFSATAAALLTTSAKQSMDLERLESTVRQTRAPFKFVLQVERLSAKKILDVMQTKMSMKRLEISKLDTSSKKNIARLDALKREVVELEKEVAAVSASAPMRLRQYIMTSALSENKFTAAEHAISQIKELSSRFGTFLGAEPVILSGSELVAVLELDSTLME